MPLAIRVPAQRVIGLARSAFPPHLVRVTRLPAPCCNAVGASPGLKGPLST